MPCYTINPNASRSHTVSHLTLQLACFHPKCEGSSYFAKKYVSQENESASQSATRLMITMEMRKLVESLALLTCTEVTSSKCSRNTYYSDWGYSWLYFVPSRNVGQYRHWTSTIFFWIFPTSLFASRSLIQCHTCWYGAWGSVVVKALRY